MYNKVECSCIACDNCGEIFQDDHTGFSLFVDENTAHEAADNQEWHCEEEGKHYCPECYTMNEEDEFFIITSRTKPTL